MSRFTCPPQRSGIVSVLSAQSDGVSNLAVILARLMAVLSDVIVLVVTWKETVTSFRNAARVGIKVPVISALLHNGKRQLDMTLYIPAEIGVGTMYFL